MYYTINNSVTINRLLKRWIAAVVVVVTLDLG